MEQIQNKVKDSKPVQFLAEVKNNASEWWDNVKNWWSDKTKDGLSFDTGVKLVKDGWTSVKNWVGDIPTVDQAIALAKSNWQSVKDWIGNIPVVSQGISLLKSGWSTVKNWIGSIPIIAQGISLFKSGWSTIKNWIGSHTVGVGISLWKNGWSSISNFIGTSVSVGISLFKSGWSSIKNFFGLANGGIVGANGGVKMFASGGIITPNMWSAMPKYAGGTNRAHGSMFVAGESGAELVGHVNGNTEVLNRFQMGQIMHSSIIAGMAQFLPVWKTLNNTLVTSANAIIQSVLVSAEAVNSHLATQVTYDPSNILSQSVYDETERIYGNSCDESAMASVLREITTDANNEQNALLREQNNLLRRLLDKDQTVRAVITAGDVVDGLNRKNRRDGKITVPVG